MLHLLPAPNAPPQNLQVFNATTTSLTVKWDHAPGPVQNYKINYQPVAGGKTLSVSLSAPSHPSLQSGDLYNLNVMGCIYPTQYVHQNFPHY